MSDRATAMAAFIDGRTPVLVGTVLGDGVHSPASLSITITPAARSAASVLQQAGCVGRDPLCPGLAVFFSVSEASLGRLTYIPDANASEAHKAHVKTYADGVCRIMTSKRCLHQALMAEFDETVAPCGDMCSVCRAVPWR